jgi:hypothetical protein
MNCVLSCYFFFYLKEKTKGKMPKKKKGRRNEKKCSHTRFIGSIYLFIQNKNIHKQTQKSSCKQKK